MKATFALYVFAALFIAACAPSHEKSESKIASSTSEQVENSQDYLSASSLFVTRSAEYRALCYQAFQTAAWQLKAVSAQSPDAELAVVLDLDETVLDNSPYSAWQVSSGQAYSSESWAKWVNLAQADAVPGAPAFLHLADSLGVALFYISNRDSSALSATIANMAQLGLPQLEEDHFYLKTTTSDKASRRQAVMDRGYTIALLIGDNLGDFHEQWDKSSTEERAAMTDAEDDRFGQRYIVLPNPIYGSWEGALYKFDRSLSDAQRDSIRFELLNETAAWAQ